MAILRWMAAMENSIGHKVKKTSLLSKADSFKVF